MAVKKKFITSDGLQFDSEYEAEFVEDVNTFFDSFVSDELKYVKSKEGSNAIKTFITIFVSDKSFNENIKKLKDLNIKYSLLEDAGNAKRKK